MARRRRTPEERAAEIDASIRAAKQDSEARALAAGAVAARWEYWDEEYEERCEDRHRPRDGEVFLIRGNGLIERGWIRADGRRFLDEVTDLPAVLPGCRCQLHFIFRLEALPPDLVTAAGRQAIAAADLWFPESRAATPRPKRTTPSRRRSRPRMAQRAQGALLLTTGIIFAAVTIYIVI